MIKVNYKIPHQMQCDRILKCRDCECYNKLVGTDKLVCMNYELASEKTFFVPPNHNYSCLSEIRKRIVELNKEIDACDNFSKLNDLTAHIKRMRLRVQVMGKKRYDDTVGLLNAYSEQCNKKILLLTEINSLRKRELKLKLNLHGK